jgi:hypothetical protein
MNLIKLGDYVYEILRHGIIIYREASPGDMPMLHAYGKHWQAVGHIQISGAAQ